MTPASLAIDVLRRRWPVLVAAAALAAVLSACRGGLVLLSKAVLDAVQAGGGSPDLVPLAGAAVALFAVQGLARVGRLLATRGAALRAEADLRGRVFTHYLGRDPARLAGEGRAEALSTLTHDTGAVRTAVGAMVTVVQRPLTALAVGGAALWMSPKLALVGVLVGPVVAGVIAWSGRRTRRSSAVHLERLGALEAEARDGLEGLRTVQAYGGEDAARRRYAEADRAQVDAALRRTLFQAAGPPMVELAAAVALGAVIVVGAGDVAAGTLTPGALVAFLVAVALLHEPLKGIAVAHGLWEEARAGLGRVIDVLERPVGRRDAPDAVDLRRGPRRITLRDVTVDRGRGPILRRLSLELRAGEIVAIEGPSGGGKSTLIDTVAGFVAPTEGEICWDGRPARGFTLSSLRRRMALVDQSPWLGRGTIADAVRLGDPGADDDAVRAALAAAGLPDDAGLLAKIPGGADARVGDGGGGVSGGERRRIALARALLRDAPVLLLDEPTEGLDPAAEARFLEAVRRVAADRIVLIATHRASCAEAADRRFSLDGGRLRRLDATGARCA